MRSTLCRAMGSARALLVERADVYAGNRGLQVDYFRHIQAHDRPRAHSAQGIGDKAHARLIGHAVDKWAHLDQLRAAAVIAISIQ